MSNMKIADNVADWLIAGAIAAFAVVSCIVVWHAATGFDDSDVKRFCPTPTDYRAYAPHAMEVGEDNPALMKLLGREVGRADRYWLDQESGFVGLLRDGCVEQRTLDIARIRRLMGLSLLTMLGRDA